MMRRFLLSSTTATSGRYMRSLSRTDTQRSLLAATSTNGSFPSYPTTVRSIWSTGTEPTAATYPLHSLTPSEISAASSAVKEFLSTAENLRFVAVTVKEDVDGPRAAEVLVLNSTTGIATELTVGLSANDGDTVVGTVSSSQDLPRGVQPMLTPEDCELAEEVCKASPEVLEALQERYGITDMNQIAADPWSVHLADEADWAMTDTESPDLPPRRLVQTFLYSRPGGSMHENAYAHPIDIVPVVDLNTRSLVRIDGMDREPPTIPDTPVQYNRNTLDQNSYLPSEWRENAIKALDITQPDGPSFTVSDGNLVTWANWKIRVGFNYRE